MRGVVPPKQVLVAVVKTAAYKANLCPTTTVLLSIAAGMYISAGGLVATVVGGGINGSVPTGLVRFAMGATFPLGLILVVIGGAELFTGNAMIMIPGVLTSKVSWNSLAKNWVLSFFGNLIGSLFFVLLMGYATQVVHTDPWRSFIVGIAEKKTHLGFGVLFAKGIVANWLVCLAVWLGLASPDAISKMFALWWPVMAFVAIGMEHSVANMYYIPMGILEGANCTFGDFLSNLIPVTLGNIVGGSLLVGMLYWKSYNHQVEDELQELPDVQEMCQSCESQRRRFSFKDDAKQSQLESQRRKSVPMIIVESNAVEAPPDGSASEPKKMS
eukprot:TRINITY_DN63768_c0_g1_i1.p1 TRINITY_DN63768_c0_g1~~TRINITY_DN63768_c0_g1_i1.p1  ORF type:complete len:328 (-),score=83.44 TRINITY_DN63768_c0_g1_i1:31-1014(-)